MSIKQGLAGQFLDRAGWGVRLSSESRLLSERRCGAGSVKASRRENRQLRGYEGSVPVRASVAWAQHMQNVKDHSRGCRLPGLLKSVAYLHCARGASIGMGEMATATCRYARPGMQRAAYAAPGFAQDSWKRHTPHAQTTDLPAVHLWNSVAALHATGR